MGLNEHGVSYDEYTAAAHMYDAITQTNLLSTRKPISKSHHPNPPARSQSVTVEKKTLHVTAIRRAKICNVVCNTHTINYTIE